MTVSMNYEIIIIDARLKFKRVHPDAKLPTKNNASDTGYDVSAVEDKVIPARGSAVVDVGLILSDITPGYWFRVEGRSGMGFKYGIQPHFGIIDNQYRGELGVKLYNQTDTDYTVTIGDRIAQFVVYKNYNTVIEEGEVEDTIRGDKGFGSSGN